MPHHLLASERDVGSRSGDPFEGVIGFCVLAVFRVVDDHGLLGEIVHALLGEGRPDAVGSKTFYGPLLISYA